MTIMPVPRITKSKKKAEPIDVQGRNPNPEYNNAPSVSKEARGIERTELDMPVQADTVDLSEPPKVKPEIGKVQVQNTPGGITIVLDDTAGNKRVVIKHPEGGGIEFTPNGGVKLIAMKKKVEVVGSDTIIVVGGDATLEYQGNLNMSVAGEFNIDCLDFNVTTKGNKTETIRGSSNTTIGRGSTQTITGSKTTYVTNSVVETYLGGHEHNVKGEFNHNIDGDAGFFASGDVDITSETDVNVSSPNTTVSGDKLSVMGGSGSIGGTAVNFTGNGAVFQAGITAPTFHGDLDGTATTSTVTQSQTYDEASMGSAGSITNTATPTFPQINADMVTAYNGSEFGIKEVLIDDDNEMKKFIDKSEDYQGVHHTRPTTGMARSAMRDTANRNNTKLTNRYIQDGVIDKSFTNPSPPKIGRIVEEEAIPIISSNTTTALNSEMYAINVTKRKFANITPSDDYNPLLKSVITASTKLNDSVSIAKFLGTEDPTNLNFLRSTSAKQQLAKYLYVHGTILQRITDNQKDFKGITFKVAEGVYRPGPTETITKDSINDLKLKGRAVVYKAVSVSGKESNSALFDIAVYLKDQAYFKEMQLSYDSLVGRDNITARLVIILPEIDDDWEAVFDRKVSTYYNGKKLSQGELVEVLNESKTIRRNRSSREYVYNENRHLTDQTLNPPSIGYDGTNGKIDPAKLTLVQEQSVDPSNNGIGPILLDPGFAVQWFRLKEAAMADGINLQITAGYRSFEYQRRIYEDDGRNYLAASAGASNHGLGKAIDLANCSFGSKIFNWMKNNGKKYGFYNVLGAKDPVHWSSTGR